jgi:hypothetical protein
MLGYASELQSAERNTGLRIEIYQYSNEQVGSHCVAC